MTAGEEKEIAATVESEKKMDVEDSEPKEEAEKGGRGGAHEAGPSIGAGGVGDLTRKAKGCMVNRYRVRGAALLLR